MTHRPRLLVSASRVCWVATGVLVAVAGAALLQFWESPGELVSRWTLGSAAFALACASVGTVIVARHPRHLVGWLFCGLGLQTAASVALRHRAEAALAAGEVMAARWPALGMMVAIGMSLPATALLLLHYPHGRLPGRRWRPVAGVALVLLVAGPVLALLSPLGLTHASPFPRLSHPLALLDAAAAQRMDALMGSANLVLVVAAAGSLAARWRQAVGVERYQIKWLAWTAVYATAAFGVAAGVLGAPPGLVFLFTFPLLPVAAAVGILRYRLYDIDRLVSRTVSWTLLSGALLAVYAAGVIGLGSVVRGLGGSSDLAVAGATLAVAALFGPLRRRVQASVDRRFNRARYDAQRTVEGFRVRLRGEVALDDVTTDLLAVVRTTVDPAGASLWLRPDPGAR